MGVLKVWNGTAWEEVVGRAAGVAVRGVDVAPMSTNVSVTDIALMDVSIGDIAIGDSIALDAEFLLLNNSGASRVYIVGIQVGPTTFELSFTTPSLGAHATNQWAFRAKAVASSRAASMSKTIAKLEMMEVATADQAGATLAVATAPLSAIRWATNAVDFGGGVTVALRIRSNAATATQTAELVSGRIRVSH